ncbi:MAG: Gfo/Idh/MocA family oxidoreductase, partial [Sedimentisphaerales bacterium]|nr:Gfo/Idh/MocA family oxidoreductase [Sedimentisphaerales bacterium]
MHTYIIVGTGGRSLMFQDALGERGKEYDSNLTGRMPATRLAAVCDINPGRVMWTQKRLKEKFNLDVAAYHSDEFDKMLSVHRPDTVIVCTKDCTHDEYICRSLAAGCDVITEKPMTTDAGKCQKIINAVSQTGKHVRVTFNYRYSPSRVRVKELLMAGIIGTVRSVEFQWLLDTRHGADYFRRWHRNKANSGGLLVHKATHHFDLVNWWLSDIPESVYACGERVFYRPEHAQRCGLEERSERCLDCPVKDRCNFDLDMAAHPTMKALYLDCEKHDGYFRDRCVFSDEIDIEDSMSVVVRYRSGALLSYSLNAFSPWEGYHIAFNGDRGRLEHRCQESSYTSGDDTATGELNQQATWIRHYPHFATPRELEVPGGEGDHGGGD